MKGFKVLNELNTLKTFKRFNVLKAQKNFCLGSMRLSCSVKYFGGNNSHGHKHGHGDGGHENDHKDHGHEHGDKHGHGHGHGHGHHHVDPIKEYFKQAYNKNHYELNHLHHHHHGETAPRFDPVKYTEKLNQQQRIERNEKVLFVDDNINPKTEKMNFGAYPSTRQINYQDTHIQEVMIPFESRFEQSSANHLDETEIKARIYNLLREFDFMEISKYSFSTSYREQGLDSLDWTAVLTSIEYEFHTVFNDTFYEHWECLDEVVKHLTKDEFVY